MPYTRFDYIVIVALDEEAQYFRNVVSCDKPIALAGATGWPIADADWKLAGNGVLASAGEMGYRSARELAAALVPQTGAAVLVNVGIAGRVHTSLEIGDVVVPEICIDVTGASKIAAAGAEPQFEHTPRFLTIPGTLAGAAYTYLTADEDYIDLITARLGESFGNAPALIRKRIRIENWPLCCIPNVGAYDPYRESLRRIDRRAGAMDMESAGVIDAATAAAGTAVLCVRGISDGGGSDKSQEETTHKDENRRFAMEAAVAALEVAFLFNAEEHRTSATPVGLSVRTTDDPIDCGWQAAYDQTETLFSLLVRSNSGELVDHPVGEIAMQLQDPSYPGAVALLGDKEAGKTTLFTFLQQKLVQPSPGKPSTDSPRSAAALLRLSQIEVWRGNKLDRLKTLMRLDRALQRVARIAAADCSRVYLLIDGLNRTGNIRIELVQRILRRMENVPGLRVALSAGSQLDLERLIEVGARLTVAMHFKLEPMDIEDPKVPDLIARFRSMQVNSRLKGEQVLKNMRSKELRAVDHFMLTQFFHTFTGPIYQNKETLAQCYNTLCAALLSQSDDNMLPMSEVAEIAFDLLISNSRSIATIASKGVVSLVSSHSSVTTYLVARHVVDVILGAKRGADGRISERLSYVFPAEVNAYTKQMMRADPRLEDDIVRVIISRHHELEVLARSHLAYLAGRVRDRNAQQMLRFLAEQDAALRSKSEAISDDERMLRRTVFISRGLLNDQNAEREYIDLVLTDVDEADFNRGFHLVYWGDVPFQPHVKMTYRDDGESPCNRTFARLVDRIRSRLPRVPLIDLVTLLSIVQMRHVAGKLRESHREVVLELLASKEIRQNFSLPDRVRGFVARIEEDIQQEKFDCATVLQEWDELWRIERTGWLRRRRDADAHRNRFWQTQRLESVAEHTISAIGLAEVFLTTRPTGEEIYDKARVISLLLIHDLAESRLGDLIEGQQNHQAEREVLYKYAAFTTYRGIGDLWSIPERFREFSDGTSISGKIALDLDRLQFSLRARAYGGGMSQEELASCERARSKIVTATVRRIDKLLENYPIAARFVRPETKY